MIRLPWSRLDLVGEYAAQTPFRIGVGDTGSLALDAEGRPVIPATTFRGALRAYVESVLRAFDSEALTTAYYMRVSGANGKATPVIRQVRLCCNSVDKRPDDLDYQGCLTESLVARWQADPVVRPDLDQVIVKSTCAACRVFGAPWLAGRVQISDLTLLDRTWDGTFTTRGGLSIQRDTGTMRAESAYIRQIVPAGTRFQFRLSVENATFAEQGMILLGLRAFQMGWIGLGADRSRGLGCGRLEIDWWNCRYIDAANMIDALLGREPAIFSEADAEARIEALADKLNGLSNTRG